jgi:diadenosine tetraphosphate (Ap4A) HIT family hydrolase
MHFDCPFCTIPAERVLRENKLCRVIHDAYPVSPGHTLVIPKRHVLSYFQATEEEKATLWAMVDVAKELIEARLSPAAYTIGINDGPVAGQTVPHLHIHLIPRYPGDTVDARGGVRWVVPEKAKYW